MKSGQWVAAVKEVRPRGGFSEETAVVLESVVALVAAAMMEPYGEQFLSRVRSAIEGTTPATAEKPEKSPAQRARTAKGVEHDALVGPKAAARMAKAAKKGKTGPRRCPKCSKGAGFGATHCQYDGTLLA